MAAAAAAPAVHTIVKEVLNVGVGLCTSYKAFKNQLRQSVDDVQRGVSHLQVGASQAQQSPGGLRESVRAIEQENLNLFDKQACLLALSSEGHARICGGRLDALHSEISRGFNSVIRTVNDSDAIRAARDFLTKLNAVAVACNCVSEDIVAAAESQQKRLSVGTSKDIEKAQTSATELYQWAKSFVPNNPGAMTKQSKLQMMPYIVAMAYATRIQALTHIQERDMVDQECDKIKYLKRARKVVEDFMAVLARVLEGVMADTSLLEVAMDYQLPMAMYLTLMTSFRASVDELLAPSVEHKEVVVWDDGLSPIRDALRLETDGAGNQAQGRTIQLDNVNESIWWANFTDTELNGLHFTQLGDSLDVRDFCYVLGAAKDERIDSFVLRPGRKSSLLQLPPVSTLRADLCAKITQARKAAHAASPPPSFARTSAPPLPAGRPLTAAAPDTLRGHSSTVMGVAVCADGQRVLSGSGDNTARVWSLSTARSLHSFSEHTQSINCVALSPDGQTAASGSSDNSVRVWSLESKDTQRTLLGHSARVRSVAFSPDGRSIASASADKTIKLWNAASGQCDATLAGHTAPVLSVAFSPDGETLISGSQDQSVRVWSVRRHAFERSLSGHSNVVWSVAVTPDGRRVVSGSDDWTVKVWSLSSGQLETTLRGHNRAVNCVAVFPDGQRIASGSKDCSVRVWNVRKRTLELTLKGHSNTVRSVAVSPDGRSVVSGSRDGTIKVWALSSGGGVR